MLCFYVIFAGWSISQYDLVNC